MFLVKAWLIFLEHRIGINVNYAYLWWEISIMNLKIR